MELDTIVCGDCLDVMRNMPDGCVDLVVTSPHYNCRKDYGEFDDQTSWAEWYQFISTVLIECKRILRDGGTLALNLPGVVRWQRDHYFKHTWQDYDPDYETHRGPEKVNGKGRVEPIGFWAFNMMCELGYRMREPIVWVKGTEGTAICSDYRMGCDSDPYMRPSHEFILLASKARWYHDGGTGRRGGDACPFLDYTKDVWHIPPSTNGVPHPAPFPEEIPKRLIQLFIHRANTQDLPEPLVFDPFIGSGTTAVAALKLGRHFYGCDINQQYVDLANERIEKTRLEMSQVEMVL